MKCEVFFKHIIIMGIFITLLIPMAFSGSTETVPPNKQEYEQDYQRATDLNTSLSRIDAIRNLNAYEAFADSVDQKWRGRNRELYARLIMVVCNPISSGIFNEERQSDLARKYALSALEEPDSLSLILELELIGNVMTNNFGPGFPGGSIFAQRRIKDTEVRLHAWKRLLEAIDPNWDSTEISSPIVIPSDSLLHKMGSWNAGMDPKIIKDSAARAEYEELIRVNKEKGEKYHEQRVYHDWLRRFPKRAERYIINAYSTPPFAIEELRKMLNDQLPDQAAKARIIAAIEKNMRESPNGTR
jgi:hypothetical protein